MKHLPVGTGEGDDFEDPAEFGEDFLTSANSERPCFEPSAMKSPANPIGLTFELFGGIFFPRSIVSSRDLS